MTRAFGTAHRNGDGDGDGDGWVLEFRREYPDAPGTVWAALTESDRLARWYGSFTGDARPGGTVTLTITSEEDVGGPPTAVRIVDCVPERRLHVVIDESDPHPWDLTVTLTPDGSGTVLDFRLVLPPGFPYCPQDLGPGWHWYLDRLGASLAGAVFPAWDDYAGLGDRYA